MAEEGGQVVVEMLIDGLNVAVEIAVHVFVVVEDLLEVLLNDGKYASKL
jgi:hypothetical protein